jgi:peptidoglycan/xylan/chitin deacetylase (PgdA/CDA1 family)
LSKRNRRPALLLLLVLGLAGEGRAGEHLLDAFDLPGRFARGGATGLVEWRHDEARSHVRCTTPGDGEIVLVTTRSPYDPPLDFSSRFPKLWLRATDVTRLAGMEFRLASDESRSDFFAFSIPIFADEQANLLQSGEWVVLTLGFGEARVVGHPDRSAIRVIDWLVRDTGSAQLRKPAQVAWGGLAAVDQAPHGVVSLTFDDGYQEHFSVAAPLLASHGFRGTAYVMPDQVAETGYMNLQELRALRDGYGWEIAAHHFTPYTDFSPEELEAVIGRTRHYLVHHGFEAGSDHLAYPLGKYDVQRVLPLVRRYFRSARLASGGRETLPPGDAHRLRAMNVLSTTTPGEIAAAARRAARYGEWLILMFHYLVDQPSFETQYSVRDFRRALELLSTEAVEVRTVGEVWRELNPRDAAAAPAR